MPFGIYRISSLGYSSLALGGSVAISFIFPCIVCIVWGHGLVILSGDSFLVRGISNSSLFAESIVILNIDIDVDSQLLQRSRPPMVLIPSLPRC